MVFNLQLLQLQLLMRQYCCDPFIGAVSMDCCGARSATAIYGQSTLFQIVVFCVNVVARSLLYIAFRFLPPEHAEWHCLAVASALIQTRINTVSLDCVEHDLPLVFMDNLLFRQTYTFGCAVPYIDHKRVPVHDWGEVCGPCSTCPLAVLQNVL